MIGCGVSIGKLSSLRRTIPHHVKAILKKHGSNAHLYLPGVSVTGGFIPGNYFDSAGTTLASVDGSVGLVLDAAGSVGADLVTNGSFASDTGWTKGAGVTISGGVCSIAAGAGYLEQAVPTAAGKTYWVTATNSGNAVYSGAWSASGQSGALSGSPGGRGVGTNKFEFVAAGAVSYIGFTATGAGALTVDNVVVREVTGIHATQSTPGFKPTERKGIVNLLTWSNDLTNAVWATQNIGSATPNSFTFAPNNASQRVQNVSTPSAPVTLAAKVYVASGTKTFKLKVWNGVSDQYSSDLVATTSPQVFILNATGGSSGVPNIAIANGSLGDAGTLIIEGVGLFQGTLTAADIIAAGGIPLTTTAPASSQVGVNYLEFDGVDDRLSLSSVPLQANDDFTLIAAARTETSASYPFVVGFTDGAAQSSHVGILFSQGKPAIEIRGSSGFVGVSASVATVQRACVISGKKVGGVLSGRVDGVSIGTYAVSAAGAVGTLTTGVIGARIYDVITLPLKGNIYCVIAIKGTVSDADLLVLEKFVAQLSGVTL